MVVLCGLAIVGAPRMNAIQLFIVCCALQCSAWPQTSEVQALLDVLIWTGRDTLAVVQDMADYQLTVTVSTQPTQQYATQPGRQQVMWSGGERSAPTHHKLGTNL